MNNKNLKEEKLTKITELTSEEEQYKYLSKLNKKLILFKKIKLKKDNESEKIIRK